MHLLAHIKMKESEKYYTFLFIERVRGNTFMVPRLSTWAREPGLF